MSQGTSLYELSRDGETLPFRGHDKPGGPGWADGARELVARFEEQTGRDVDRAVATARSFGQALGLEPKELELLIWSAALYDVGMLTVPDDVMSKGGRLEGGDLHQIRRHPLASAEMILEISPRLDRVAEAARTHHEHWDGQGYPAGLAGHEIPLHGRILAIVDTYDALTNFRPVRQGVFTDAAAREYLEVERAKRFDPSLVSTFLGEIDPSDRRRPARRRKA